MIGLNRMYVGAHLPLDIVGGVSVGLVCGGIVVVVAQRVTARWRSPSRSHWP